MDRIANSETSVFQHIKVAVIDDHDLIREGISTVLLHAGIKNVDKFARASDLISRMNEGNNYDFYILDLELPDLDGFVLIEMIRGQNPVARLIISTVHDEIWTLRKLLARDVNAIVYKSGESEEIVTAIKEIMKGNDYYCKGVRNTLDSLSNTSQYPSTRELEVLYQIAQGKTSREIAASIFVTENTVEAHRKALFSKLGAVNSVDLIVKAIAKGYIKKSDLKG